MSNIGGKRETRERSSFYGARRKTSAILDIGASLSAPPNSTIGRHLTICYESLSEASKNRIGDASDTTSATH